MGNKRKKRLQVSGLNQVKKIIGAEMINHKIDMKEIISLNPENKGLAKFLILAFKKTI